MKVISFYNSNINPKVVEYQKKVFDHFGLPIEQIETGMRHPEAIDFYLKTADWDSVAIFDIDCIPLVNNLIEIAEMGVQTGCLYGAAQCANHLNDFVYCSPAFMCFKKATWLAAGKPSFVEGNGFDVGGYFSSLVQMLLLYPTHVEAPKWKLTPTEYFGNGTTYDDIVYHAFESRYNNVSTSMFINKCKEVISE